MGKIQGLLIQIRRTALTVTFCLCFFFLKQISSSSRPGCSLRSKFYLFEARYVQDGDFIIGGIFTVRYQLHRQYDSQLKLSYMVCQLAIPQYYRHLLAFIFAIDEINSNPYFLPNVTLGYHALDSCGDINKAAENTLQILSGAGEFVPNYVCGKHGELAGVIGDLSSQTSISIANILTLYGYPQISYGATDPILANKRLFPSTFRAASNDLQQFIPIVLLLKDFGWNWVGVFASDDINGETQSRELERIATTYGVCIEYTLYFPSKFSSNREQILNSNKLIIRRSTSVVVILCGTVSTYSLLLFMTENVDIHQKTFIIPASWDIIFSSIGRYVSPFNGSLTFAYPRKLMPRFGAFLENVSKSSRPVDRLLEDIFAEFFQCLTSDVLWNAFKIIAYKKMLFNCNDTDPLTKVGNFYYDTKIFGKSYLVYKAVYAMANALQEMSHVSMNPDKSDRQAHKRNYRHFLRKINFTDPTGGHVFFDEDGGWGFTHYHINNYVIWSNKTSAAYPVGVYTKLPPNKEGEFHIFYQNIKWKYATQEVPRSRCSEDCPPGYRRVLQRGRHNCCFDCIPCSDGEISNITDGEFCHKCPDDQYPNEKRDGCVLKPTEFLSYQEDAVALFLGIISVFLSVITSIIVAMFFIHRNTPIVRANNRNLSFILLVSIMLSFLCVFLFLGCPVDITCMLRQTAPGIALSVALSSLLAKTIMVCIAFRATKPGSYWRKWIGVKIPNCVVFVCSFIQVVICICWLSISPPFQEMNTHSYPEKIIIQCNEGSVVAFYTVLGYMGFLAAVSFIVAFLARKLPDSFNEAKYITFSMLVFCSVWISFIPAYMSVMGKNTVIVEIFAILASSAGILFCIFFPKCFNILLRPNLNTKKHLMRLR